MFFSDTPKYIDLKYIVEFVVVGPVEKKLAEQVKIHY